MANRPVKKERSPNRTRSYLELPQDYQAALDGHHAGLGAKLNQTLQAISEALEARAGLRGDIEQAASLQLNDNRAVNVQDPVRPGDIVNLRTLKDYSRCDFLAARLDESPEWDELVNDADIEESTVGFGYPFAFGYTLVQPANPTAASPIASANDIIVFPIVTPTELVIGKVVCEVTTIDAGKDFSIGLYSKDKTTLLLDTGAQSAGSTGIKNISVGPVTLPADTYLLAFTSNGTPAMRCITGDANVNNFFNANNNWQGTNGTGSTSAALPSSLGTLTATGAGRHCPLVLFEE